MDFVVTGVLKNIPKNSHVTGDFFAYIETLNAMRPPQEDWNGQNLDIFILLHEGVDPRVLEVK
jgi:hypothetical protein